MAAKKIDYYKLMTSEWLQNSKNASFSVTIDKTATNQNTLALSTDSSKWEKMIKVPLVPKACRKRIIVKVRVGLEHRGSQDTISFIVADKTWGVGFLLTYNYTGTGPRNPYRPVEGKPANTLNNGSPLDRPEESAVSTQMNPRVYEMTFEMNEEKVVGICSSSLDGGHMIITTYSNTLSLSSDLFLEVYRGEPTARYFLNFVEVSVETLE